MYFVIITYPFLIYFIIILFQIANVNLIELKSFEDDFRGIIEQTLLFVKSVTDYSVSLKNTNTKYWKVMISQALEILNKVCNKK